MILLIPKTLKNRGFTELAKRCNEPMLYQNHHLSSLTLLQLLWQVPPPQLQCSEHSCFHLTNEMYILSLRTEGEGRRRLLVK